VSIHKAEPLDEQIADLEDRPLPRPAEDRLDSWKEIALYLNRDVRTVRRWEKNQGLPVRRHQHQKGASVYAYRSEIDTWWKGKAERLADEPSSGADSSDGNDLNDPARRGRRRLWAIAGVVALVTLATYIYFLKRPPTNSSVPLPSKLMLAVLPFQNLTGEPAQDFVSDGFTEEMITQVSGLQPDRLGVIARTSSMAYKGTNKPVSQIGQELAADYILEGSVRRWGNEVRVTAQLIQARDQTHIWAQNYESTQRDVLRLQSEIAQAIAQQIDVKLLAPHNPSLAKHRPIDPRAYELYLKGRHFLEQRSRDDLQKSVECFKQAVAIDPEYAAGYAGLADAYNLIGFYGMDRNLDTVGEAKIAADKALQLDDSMAAAHAAQAYTDFMWQGNWPEAEKEFRRAIELDDNYVPAHQWYALYLAATGRTDESVSQMQYAKRLDPLSPAVHAGLAYMHYFARNHEQAVQYAQTALKLNPNSIPAHAVLGWAYTEQKKYTAAIAELQSAAKLSGNVPVYRCALARTHALSGNIGEASKILAEVLQTKTHPTGSGSALAAGYLAMGNDEEALHWLEQTAPGDIQANWLRVDPAFDSVRDNPRFVAVVNRIGTKTD